MKKLGYAVIMFFVLSSYASAAKVANVAITGTIESTFSVTITPSTIAGTLVLTSSIATSNLVFASAEFITNKNNWSIGVYSLNGSKLVGSTGESLAYTFSLGDIVGMQNLTLGKSEMPIRTSMKGKASSLIKDLKITYTGNPLLQEGVYTDSIFFVIGTD